MHKVIILCIFAIALFSEMTVFGQPSDEVLHDITIHRFPGSGVGMGMVETGYDPSDPKNSGSLVVSVVNRSTRNLTVNTDDIRLCALGYHSIYLNGTPFLSKGKLTVAAGETRKILDVHLWEILDPAHLSSQDVIRWGYIQFSPVNGSAPSMSPISYVKDTYLDQCVLWVEHVRDRNVHRSRPVSISVLAPSRGALNK